MDCHQSQNEFQMRAKTTRTMMTPIAMPMSSMIMPGGPPSGFRRDQDVDGGELTKMMGAVDAFDDDGCADLQSESAHLYVALAARETGPAARPRRRDQYALGAGADGQPFGDVPVAGIGGDLGLRRGGLRRTDPDEPPARREDRSDGDEDHARPARRIVGGEGIPDGADRTCGGPDQQQPEGDHEDLQGREDGRRPQQSERHEKRRPVDLHFERFPLG